MAIYMKIDGVSGNVTAKGHEKSTELKSVATGFSRNIQTKLGVGGNRESSAPNFQEMTITKLADSSSADLYQRALSGKAIPTVTINFCHTGDSLTPHATHTLTNVIISGIDEVATSAHATPLETLELNFTQIEKKFVSRDSSNKMQSPKSVGYKLEEGELM